MCGFSFFYNFKSSFSESDIENLTTLSLHDLNRRGPDNFQYIKKLKKKLLMCHARLSILDLSANANQPMTSANGNNIIIFNGEIYNHIKLRKNFFNKDHFWKTSSDTETLLELINKLGVEQALQACTGMFSLCVFNKKNKTISIARDKFGEKPLYYFWNEKYFCGGSRISVIKDFSTKIFDKDGLNQYFVSGFISSPKTIYKDIKKIEPGQIITYCTVTGKIINKFKFYDIQEEMLSIKRSKNLDKDYLQDNLKKNILDI